MDFFFAMTSQSLRIQYRGPNGRYTREPANNLHANAAVQSGTMVALPGQCLYVFPFLIDLGFGMYVRQGDSIHTRRISIRYSISNSSAEPNNVPAQVRVLLFVDKQCHGNMPTTNTFWDQLGPNPILWMPSWLEMDRFDVLYDLVHAMDAQIISATTYTSALTTDLQINVPEVTEATAQNAYDMESAGTVGAFEAAYNVPQTSIVGTSTTAASTNTQNFPATLGTETGTIGIVRAIAVGGQLNVGSRSTATTGGIIGALEGDVGVAGPTVLASEESVNLTSVSGSETIGVAVTIPVLTDCFEINTETNTGPLGTSAIQVPAVITTYNQNVPTYEITADFPEQITGALVNVPEVNSTTVVPASVLTGTNVIPENDGTMQTTVLRSETFTVNKNVEYFVQYTGPTGNIEDVAMNGIFLAFALSNSSLPVTITYSARLLYDT